MTLEKFIEKAIAKHGDKYDYSLVDYKNNKTPITVKCKDCGTIFYPRPDNFLHGTGCPTCGRERAKKSVSDTRETFIEKAIAKHGDKYDYSLVDYVKSTVKVKIKCNKCGAIFEQTPVMHLSGNGCSVCNPPHKRLTHEEFVERLSKTHPNLEVLSQYNGKDRKITVRCKIHDYTYETTPHRLVQGMNCKYCYNDRRGNSLRNDINELRNRINVIYNGKYMLPKLEDEYKNNKSVITVICPIHGEFKSTANKMLRGHSCPYCDESHNERMLAQLLDKNNIEYIREHTFPWLGRQTLDFYLPKHNVAIEIQGEFHFENIRLNNKVVNHIKQLNRDVKKFNLCKENGIRVIYLIPTHLMKYSDINEIYSSDNVIEITENNEVFGKIYNYIKSINNE